MYCDALTLTAVAAELHDKLLGGRIQRVFLLHRLAVGLEVYAHRQRHYLLISAQPEEGGRVHLVPDKLRRGPDLPTPLFLRLRKWARSAHLTAIRQPPAERILRLTIEGREGTMALVAEVMGRRSNIILVGEDGTILECAKHIPAHQNRYRVLLPGYLYVPPPAQKKADPLAMSPDTLAPLLKEQDAELLLWQKLVASLRGVSPLLAREAVFRTTGDARSGEGDAATALEELQQLLNLGATGKWRPTVALEEGEVIAYAPYALTQYGQHEARETISAAMNSYYGQQSGRDAYAVARNKLLEVIAQQRQRQLRKRRALARSEPTPGRLEELRRHGELLLAYAHQVSPGQEYLVVDLGLGELPETIALDPHRSAIENAQDYFRRYEKAKSAVAEVPRVLAKVDAELAFLGQLSTDLDLATDRSGIEAVRSALQHAGYLAPSRRNVRPPKQGPLRVQSDEGFVILAGRNSWQNEEVTFRRSSPQDVWLHAQGVSGAHVVIRSEGREVPEATLRQAAMLAARFSAARREKNVAVDYTLRKNVRRLRGGRPGQVTYKRQKTIIVTPEE
jgi:predicted ribosome quality control (RQC) complex YloA/Tae2 family protein